MNQDYEQLLQVMKSRRSIRKFRPDPVPQALIEQLVEAARWAPSAGNRQNFRFLVISRPERLRAMAEAVDAVIDQVRDNLREKFRKESEQYLANFTHFAAAPLVLAPIHRTARSLVIQALFPPDQIPEAADEESLCSVSAAIDHLLLAAATLGLGACWMTGPLLARPQLEALLPVPAGWTLSALVPIGYPDEDPVPPKRRRLDLLIHQEKGE